MVGAACALFGIVLGNTFTIVHFVGKEGGSIGVLEAIPYVFQTTEPIGYLFYAIGVWNGWKFAVVNPE